MSSSRFGLDARPMFHRTKDALEARLTVVFTALGVGRPDSDDTEEDYHDTALVPVVHRRD